MHIPQIREKLSWVPIKVKPLLNGEELSIATAFVYEYQNRTFLVTNYHVVSGRHPETKTILSPLAVTPDSLLLGLPTDSGEDDGRGAQLLHWKWYTLALFTDEEYPRPIWSEHPEHGSRFDVVAIPLTGFDVTRVLAANAAKLDLDNFRIYPSMEAFVLGYPRGMSGGGHFPIWKRATVATEPDFDLDGLPRFYIDTATREGMSGSPVYAQEVGYWLPEGETDHSKANLGKGKRFVGVYSGRLGAEDEFKAQLGIVWKESALLSLIESILE